jgi:hypothetical protein
MKNFDFNNGIFSLVALRCTGDESVPTDDGTGLLNISGGLKKP